MRVSEFHFELPPECIADRPCEPRDAARLLVHEMGEDRTTHLRVGDLHRVLSAGDLLILNDTRVLPNRLVGRLATGARAEVLILERDGRTARGYVKPSRKMRVGVPVELEGGRIRMTPLQAFGGGLFRFELDVADGGDLDAALEVAGRAPLPPYLRRDDADDPAFDRVRYQTVFARTPGAVAAPTAGLHFTDQLLRQLGEGGVERAFVTLHVGEGTFAPIRVERVEDHAMHEEHYELPPETATAVERTRAEGGRVVAVGTTAARTLETCAAPGRTVEAGAGRTRLFLYPGRPLRVVDVLLTNFHLPESTLLMLVAAFAGRERVLRLYQEAIESGYRFYSYGDAMLLLP